jgi:glycosyltransferase involved in cell wall biosynthesis
VESRFEDHVGEIRITVGIPTFNRADLLREAIASVLEQTYTDFRLIVSDNASTDETAKVVATFADPRLEYVRAETNVGMIGNINRLIALADTEFLMLLPDDDRLYPDYLAAVVDVLQRNPRVGLVHTAVKEIGIDSSIEESARLIESNVPVTAESGRSFLERSMTTATVVFFSSAAYRTCAIRDAGGMQSTELPLADVPLFMRIALNWNIAYLDRPLAAFRVHDQTETARLAPRGENEASARERLLTYGRIMFDRRIGFLDKAGLPCDEAAKYRSLASLRFLADRAGLGAPWLQTWREFVQIARLHPPILRHPMALRFLAAQCGGRVLRHAASRAASVVSDVTRTAQVRRARAGTAPGADHSDSA